MDNWDALSASRFVDRALTLALSPPLAIFGGLVNHGPRSQRKISITFDDGPSSPCTEHLLDTLDELGVPATFFCVGWNVKQNPGIAARAAAAGHDVGNHSMFHRRMAGMMPLGGSHIDDAEKVISDAISKIPRLYRPPWGWLSPFELARLRARGYAIVGWDVYTRDWMYPENDGHKMAQHVLAKAIGGSIVLFHDGLSMTSEWSKTETERAVRTIVPMARDQGFEFVTVSRLIDRAAYAS